MDDARLTRLTKHLETVLNGKTSITPRNAALFLEAIYSQPEPVSCIHKIVTNPTGLSSLQKAVFSDISLSFLTTHSTRLILYLRSPELKDIGGGDYVSRVTRSITYPPVFWQAFVDQFRLGKLAGASQLAFGWLLLQLASLPDEAADPYRELARSDGVVDALIASPDADARATGHALKHLIETRSLGAGFDVECGPGGRHDNDHVDFRKIAILPTPDEILCKRPEFLRTAAEVEEVDVDLRVATHLDNQFRLYREDMLYELREELQIALGHKRGKHRGLIVENLRLVGMYGKSLTSDERGRNDKWGLILQCPQGYDFWFFKKDRPRNREQYLQDDRNKRYIKDMSTAALVVDGRVVAFPTVRRITLLLASRPPAFVLQIEHKDAFVSAFCSFRRAKNITLVQIDTAVFSYEPVLKALQRITHLPLLSELILWDPNGPPNTPLASPKLSRLVELLKQKPAQDLSSLIGTSKSIVLDTAQHSALVSGLTQSVSIIQGPPGTGKSFIGALLAKVLHDATASTILVCCYTNHALDQFLEDLLDIGIPQGSIVRLGGKSTARTEPLSLYNQKASGAKFGRSDWREIDMYRTCSSNALDRLEKTFKANQYLTVSHKNLLAHTEFEDEDFFYALSIPQSTADDGMRRVGGDGKEISSDFLIRRWLTGNDAGIFRDAPNVHEMAHIWAMPRDLRRQKREEWESAVLNAQAVALYTQGRAFDDYQMQLEQKFSEGDGHVLRSKRIIGCTTTAAAKYTEHLRAADPDVVLVEEAGEILETHVITALGNSTERLILIGDHKQLRPKVDNYRLTVEKGDGYDLNRSLFERLVLKGFHHDTLSKQHRMRPEISSYIRRLTYPDLVDAPQTLKRPDLRGVRDNVIFITHDKPEDQDDAPGDVHEVGYKASKQNEFELEMVLKTLRYLGQQGYGTDKIVILTPYLGQLHRFREELRKDSDPILNDLDSFDLVRAGLLSPGAASIAKKPIRLATIDNYQGEESDIVIVSLVRSNSSHEIGFMSSPERLNVLLSRARDALIMIGNPDTFSKSRKGQELWSRLFLMMKDDGHVYDGLPVKCERHPDRTALLARPTDFDEKCPDGGCLAPCSAILTCNIHSCPSRCHQISDHSQMKCERVLEDNCSNGHRRTWKCSDNPPLNCDHCDRAAAAAEKKRKEAFEAQKEREAKQREYARKLAEIDAEIETERQAQLERERERQRAATLLQREKDRDALISRGAKSSTTSGNGVSASRTSTSATASLSSHPPPPVLETPSSAAGTGDENEASPESEGNSSADPESLDVQPSYSQSPSECEWQRQKDMEGADNPSIDAIMEMTGLEDVKAQVLRVKSKIDVSIRQGTSVKGERFNVVMLGNPGTGKTTIARLYAKFLASVDVIPGSEFFETSGSRLADEGIPGIKKHLERILESGGGAIFVDEAYQLVSGGAIGGSFVLDYLLTEMENHVGKLVFIFAGYNKEMEKFFEHNPGLNSRVPYRLKFQDYTDDELIAMLNHLIVKKYSGRMKVEGGSHGLYIRIAVRRLGRGRGRDGFGNARALHIMFTAISERQASRLTEQRKRGLVSDDFLFTKDDIIGPDPSKAVLKSASWTKLMALTGLSAVKQTVQNLFDIIKTNYYRELKEKEPIQMSLNCVFLGNPGTGKTTVAQLYGGILTDLGLLSNGDVVLKNPSDFIGSVLGESESKTKAILASTVGKVLVIDEAYMLHGMTGVGSTADPYKTAVIDTIVAEVQSVPGEDRCVILCGYEAQMVKMFQDVNPGLSRRFRIENPFRFENFSDDELLSILNHKMKQQGVDATSEAKAVAIDVLSRARNRPNFGNGGEVENLLDQAKARAQSRRSTSASSRPGDDILFEPVDFDPEFSRISQSKESLQRLFSDVVGCEDVVTKLEEYQNIARMMQARGKDIRQARHLIPTNFVFKGPPGTGKTTTARKMGSVFYDMGFLSSAEVIECSASDLVGQHVGQTGPKTMQLFRKALGKVLFIDEAYRLSEGAFAKEAVDELVGILTQDEFIGRLVVILAGYDAEMNQLLSVNTGLSSRFPEEIHFGHFKPAMCIRILDQELSKEQVSCPLFSSEDSKAYASLTAIFVSLSALPSWGNARDVKELGKRMLRVAFKHAAQTGDVKLSLSNDDILSCATAMLDERRSRSSDVPTVLSNISHLYPSAQLPPAAAPAPPPMSTSQAVAEPLASIVPASAEDDFEADFEADFERDPGVPDDVWLQLQADKKAAQDAQAREEATIREMEKDAESARSAEKAAKARHVELAKRARNNDQAAKLLEQQRLEKVRAAAEAETRARALEAERQRQIEERRKEARVQEKLRTMGLCVAGFRWIKQEGGYRCAGGAHQVSNAELGLT